MRTYFTASLTVAALILISFLVVEALGIPLLTDPSDRLSQAGIIGAALSVGLLLSDVFIPVPSSIIMIANGAVFGVVGGTLLTLTGGVGGTMIGFVVGRRGGRLIRRFVSPVEQQRADALIARWGLSAIIVTRPMPILAETVAIMAGATSLGWRRTLAGSVLGLFPPALVYAIAGAITTDVESGILVFGAVLLMATLTWLVWRRLESRFTHTATTPPSAST